MNDSQIVKYFLTSAKVKLVGNQSLIKQSEASKAKGGV